jgi:hypothetical protein
MTPDELEIEHGVQSAWREPIVSFIVQNEGRNRVCVAS